MKNLLILIIMSLQFCMSSIQASSFDSKPLRYTSSLQELEQQLNTQNTEIINLKARIVTLEERLQNSPNSSTIINPPLNNDDIVAIPDASNHDSNLFNKTLVNDDIFKVVDKPAVKVANAKPILKDAESSNDKSLYDSALKLYKLEKYTEAAAAFDNFLNTQPNNPLCSNAYFWTGEIFSKKKMYEKAAISYLKGYKQFPKGFKASDSLLHLAMSLGELKKLNEACAMLNKLENDFPKRSQESVSKAKELKSKYNCK